MRHTIQAEKTNDLVEDTLFFMGEFEALERAVGGLCEASRIERLRLVTHVRECEHAAVEAKKDLHRFDEIDEQRAGIHDELLAVFDRGRRTISQDAQAVGFDYTRTDLLEQGGVTAMVERRRRLYARVTEREAEAL